MYADRIHKKGIAMPHRRLILWLAALLGPYAVLAALLTDRRHTPAMGGGYYNLDTFVYSWTLVALTGLWTLVVLSIALNMQGNPRPFFALAAVGGVLLAVALSLYGGNLG